MLKKFFCKRLLGLVPLLALVIWSAPALSAEFSADMLDRSKKGKIFVQGSKYRMDLIESGKNIFVVTDTAANITRVFNPGEKKFMEMTGDDFRILSNDPFKAAKYMANKYETQNEGTETVSGYVCDKLVISMQGQKIMTQWTARELSFPIKIVQHAKNQDVTMELVNFRLEPVSNDLFAIPSGYTQMEDPKKKKQEMEKKEAALPALSSVGSDKVPCMVRVSDGGELRVPLDTKREAKVTIINRKAEVAEVSVLPFNDGKQVESIGVSPWKLERKGSRQDRKFNDSFFSSSSFIVDEVRIKVDKGSVYANVEQRGKFRKDLYNRGNLQNSSSVSSDKKLSVQITGENPLGPETRGEFILKSKKEPESERVQFVLKNNESKTWNYPAQRQISNVDVIIKRFEGSARISLIQPSPKEIDVQEFVLEPGKTKKDVDKDRDLVLTLNATGATVTGKMKIEKADSFSDTIQIDLAAGETKNWIFPKKKRTVEIIFDITSGSAEVRLDQLSAKKEAKLKPATKIVRPTISKQEQFKIIIEAINANDIATVKAEIDNGMDINFKRRGRTSLMKAANIGTPDMVSMLISRGADINYKTKDGMTALLSALDNQKYWLQIVPILINAGADVNATVKWNGYTPLWKAVGRISSKNKDEAVKIIKLLLSKGADVNAGMVSKNKKFDGYTLLMNVSEKGYVDMVKLFLSHGAAVNVRTKKGKAAIDYAQEKGHQEIVKLLSAKGKTLTAPTPLKEKAKIAEPESQQPSVSKEQQAIMGGEIPTYKGAKITKSITQGNRTMIEMESTASPAEIMNFYKTEMTNKGWSVKMSMAKSVMATAMLFKGKQTFLLSAGQRGGKTKVTLSMSGK